MALQRDWLFDRPVVLLLIHYSGCNQEKGGPAGQETEH